MRNRLQCGLVALIAMVTMSIACDRQEAVVRNEPSIKPGINSRFKGDVNVDEWVKRFESESREVYHYRDAVIAALGLEPGMDVADIGAGTGFYSLAFAERVKPGGEVYAVDIARPFLEHIDAEAQQRDIANIKTIQCLETTTGLDSDSVDLAFICDTYHHFEFPMSTLASLYRAMRTGGRVCIVEFIRHDVDGGRDDAKWTALPQARREWIASHVRCDRDTIVRECGMVGFRLAENQPDAVNELLSENRMLVFVKP